MTENAKKIIVIAPKSEAAQEKENQKKAAIISFFVMGGIIALLFIVAFSNMPKPEDLEGGGGVAVSLGQPDAGGPSAQASAKQQKSSTNQEQVDDPIISQDDPDAVAIKTQKNKKKVENKPDPKPKLDEDLSDILGSLNKPKTSGTGAGTNAGNAGSPTGQAGGNETGGSGTSGSGGGTSAGKGWGMTNYNLGGRKITKQPSNDDEFNVNGTVIVDIWVDRTGKVVKTDVARGSSNSPQLRDLAEKLARKTEFQSNFSDDDLRKGTITFTFKI